MNVIITLDEEDYIMSLSEAKKFCDGAVKVGNNILKIDGGEITLSNHEAQTLHVQIHPDRDYFFSPFPAGGGLVPNIGDPGAAAGREGRAADNTLGDGRSTIPYRGFRSAFEHGCPG